MLVKNWMTTEVVTIDADASMDHAAKIMRENNIRMLPVMRRGRLCGVLTNGDLKRASASDATTLDIHELLYLVSRIKASQIMSSHPVTVPVDFTMEETAEILMSKKISGVPVVDADEQVVGIVTQTDIFRMLVNLSGIGKRGIQFAFSIDDHPGAIKAITDVLRSFGGRMVSLLSSYDSDTEGQRRVYLRAYQIDRDHLPALVAALRREARLRYMVDHATNRREVFE